MVTDSSIWAMICGADSGDLRPQLKELRLLAVELELEHAVEVVLEAIAVDATEGRSGSSVGGALNFFFEDHSRKASRRVLFVVCVVSSGSEWI